MFINIVTRRITTTLMSSNKAAMRSPALPDKAIAIPNNKAKIITCNILPCAKAANGLLGNI